LEPAGVLLITSILLVVALVLLTISLMRLRGAARELEAALEDESGARARESLLLQMSLAVNSALALTEVLDVALTQAGAIMGAVAGAMYLVKPGTVEMHREAWYRIKERARGAMRLLEEDPVRSAVVAMRPLVVKLDPKSAPALEDGGHPPYALVVPIHHSAHLVGAMELYLNLWRELTEDQKELLKGVASQTAIAISHAQLFKAHEDNALTDELTRLPNRRALAQRFLQTMQRARRHHEWIAFLMLDLDRFKWVNDTFGHLNGDAVLAELATVFNAEVRESDVCARYGGEEFSIVLHETDVTGARALAERIRTKVEQTTFAGGVRLTISIGVAATDDPDLFTTLLERADQALYAAKQNGRNQVRVTDLKVVSERKPA
jgi:diguanylate cyclase (GGDEF)-like protein